MQHIIDLDEGKRTDQMENESIVGVMLASKDILMHMKKGIK